MFEDMEGLEERRLVAAPDQNHAELEPVLDPDGDLLDRVVRLERVKAAADAEQMILYAAMATRAETWQHNHDPGYADPVGPDDLVAAEIGPALRLAPRTAAIRVRRAVEIATRLPHTLAAYRRGDLDLGRVLAIDDATNMLSDTDAARVEALCCWRGGPDRRRTQRRAAQGRDPGRPRRRRETPQGGDPRLIGHPVPGP